MVLASINTRHEGGAMTLAEPTARPFREGLLRLEPPRLLASRCVTCGAKAFPARTFCPACRAVDGLVETELTLRGRVHTFTVVRQAPSGVEVPYVLAQIDLPADDVRLMATVGGVAPEDVVIDMPVTLDLVPFGVDADGAPLLGYTFRATTPEETAR
jgi:uncharacterized OB-fold protein